MTVAPATMTASTAIAAAIHLHSVPLRMMNQFGFLQCSFRLRHSYRPGKTAGKI